MLFGITSATTRKPIVMKRILAILPLLSLIVIGCNREPFADATVNLNPGYVGEMLRFTSYSTNTDYVEWDMDDGIMYNEPIVDHYFIDPGYYDVKLRAFGTKGGVSTAVIPMEIIGAELTVEVVEYYDEYLVPDARVRLYPSLINWEEETKLVAEGYTDSNGQVTFENLSYTQYYVDVFEANHDNYTLKGDDVNFIITPLLDDDYIWTAYVDYYAKKSATVGDSQKAEKAAAASMNRVAPELGTKIPRERK
jgi:hypothetical protein